MALDLADPLEWVNRPDPVEVARVDRVEQVALYKAAAEEIFGKDYGFTAGQLTDGIRSRSRQHVGYLAFIDGAPAGIGRLYTHPDSAFGGLYGGGTRPAFRGRGVYRALVAARARDALGTGAKYLIVDALPTSRPILQRLGFQHVADTWPCEWKPPVTAGASSSQTSPRDPSPGSRS
jgi:GNAT superfamily N-acetyltransferase